VISEKDPLKVYSPKPSNPFDQARTRRAMTVEVLGPTTLLDRGERGAGFARGKSQIRDQATRQGVDITGTYFAWCDADPVVLLRHRERETVAVVQGTASRR
jgi:hypothetical protein